MAKPKTMVEVYSTLYDAAELVKKMVGTRTKGERVLLSNNALNKMSDCQDFLVRHPDWAEEAPKRAKKAEKETW